MRYGFLLTTYNDAEQACTMYDSLKKSLPSGESYGLVVVDGGSSDEQQKLIQENIGAIQDSHKDLSTCLNLGYETLLRTNHDYIFWLHTDCRYYQPDWANKLINIYESIWPLVGRMGPATSNIDNSISCLQSGEILRHANQCPTLMSAEFIKQVVDRYGFLYDPSFIGIGGCEDVDLWQRMVEMGYNSCICSLVDLWHHGAGSRFSAGRDTSSDQIHNREVYHRKWEHGTYNNQLGPACTLDLSEINKELLDRYGELRDEVISLIPVRNAISEEMTGKFYRREYNR